MLHLIAFWANSSIQIHYFYSVIFIRQANNNFHPGLAFFAGQ